jgi:hypothetical protein
MKAQVENIVKPKQFSAVWRDSIGKLHQFDTDNQHTAEKKAFIYESGVVYIDLRYKAKLRLYKYILRKSF